MLERMSELAADHEGSIKSIGDKFSVLRRAIQDYNQRLELAMVGGAGGGQQL